MDKTTRIALTSMIGETILNVSLGKLDGEDAAIIETENRALYLLESGTYTNNIGVAHGLIIRKIDIFPAQFIERK